MEELENYEEYLSWCYCNNIYLYAFTQNCESGFCKITKWSNGEKQTGKKFFPVSEVDKVITQLYRDIYLKNNNNQILKTG